MSEMVRQTLFTGTVANKTDNERAKRADHARSNVNEVREYMEGKNAEQ